MTDTDIALLKGFLSMGATLLWMPDEKTARKIVRVGAGPTVAPDDEPEPADCAYFANGEYVSLAFTEAYEFVQVVQLFLPLP